MAGGGPSIFKQSRFVGADGVAGSRHLHDYRIELAVHKCENRFGNHQLYGPMLQKVMAEFTVLGFVASALFWQSKGLVAHATESVAEFEIAHIWIFFVGCYYVVLAFQNIKIAADLTAKSQRQHLISKENLLSQLQNNSQRRDWLPPPSPEVRRRSRRSARTCCFVNVVGFLFRNVQREKIQEELGSRSRHLTFQSMKSTSFVMRCWQAFMFRCFLGLGSICFS